MYIWMIRIYQMLASRVRNGPGNWMRGIDQISRGQPLSRRAFPGLISQISKVTTKQNLKYHSLKFHPCRSELNYLFLGGHFSQWERDRDTKRNGRRYRGRWSIHVHISINSQKDKIWLKARNWDYTVPIRLECVSTDQLNLNEIKWRFLEM